MADVFEETGYQSTRKTPEEEELTSRASAAARHALADASFVGAQVKEPETHEGQLSFEGVTPKQLPNKIRESIDEGRASGVTDKLKRQEVARKVPKLGGFGKRV
jgi:hypothetical protein